MSDTVATKPTFRCLPAFRGTYLAHEGPCTLSSVIAACGHNRAGAWLALFDAGPEGFKGDDQRLAVYVGPEGTQAGTPWITFEHGLWVVVAGNPHGHPEEVTPGVPSMVPPLSLSMTILHVEA